VIRLDSIAFGVIRICVEGVQVGTNSLNWRKVLVSIRIVRGRSGFMKHTCTADAPVSRILFWVDSGSPTVLLFTGSESIVADIASQRGLGSLDSAE
jgi:hypothetical protein